MSDDGKAAQKLLQGWIAGTLSKARGDGNMPLMITKVDVPTDENGDYADYIEVTLQSGRKVHILLTTFELEPDLPF